MEHVLLSLSLKRARIYGHVKRVYWLTVLSTSKLLRKNYFSTSAIDFNSFIYKPWAYRYVTGSGKTGLIATMTDIHFLLVRESCTHALPRNTKYLIIDGQVCFYRRLFTDAVKPSGCISWPRRALIGLHGVPGCSSRQSWPPLWILPVCVPC